MILVTGGAGFVGSHLCEALLGQGKEVTCVDNFCDFYDPATKEKNLAACLSNPRFRLVRADIRDAEAMREVFASHKIEAVCHLAAMAGVRPSMLQPELYYEVNVSGTLNLLQRCKEYQINRFVFASSSSVYGNNVKLPFCEDDRVDSPISPYAATKKAGELLCHTWHHLYGISVLCLRFFTVYGARQRPDLAIHKFASLMSQGKPIPLFGKGSSRDYTHISDIITGILAALELVSKQLCYDVINLGNDQAVSLWDMISALERHSGISARLDALAAQEGDILHTRADISKAFHLLGYKPQTSFDEGIRMFWEWFAAQ